MENGLLENYDTKDLYFGNYPQPGIMQVAIWLQRKEFNKLYPGCEIEIIHLKDFIRIIAHEPEEKDSFTLYRGDFVQDATFRQHIRELQDFFKKKYPDCEIKKEAVEDDGIRVVAIKKRTL